MASLYKRATLRQARTLRIIAGAVKNAADAHAVALPRSFARSVAKRATGTLTAQWPDVLALRIDAASERVEGVISRRPEHRSAQIAKRTQGGRLGLRRRSPLRQLWKDISRGLWRIRRAQGEEQRYQAYIEILQMIDRAASREETMMLPNGDQGGAA